ncbi:MAG: glycosyltransferase family 1 protein [Calditrichaeota bacterium]|nr:MAG: glycosyltransferase family 1 protein [Calditrichota bacterium]
MKKKILFLLKLPPPVTGATLMNQYVCENKSLDNIFITQTIKISYAQNNINLATFSWGKIIIIAKILFKLVLQILTFRPDLVYFQISPLGFAFYRDLFFVTTIKIFRKKILIHLHGKGIDNKVKGSSFQESLYKFAFKNVHIICLSELIKNDIAYVYTEKPFIVNNGIPQKTIVKTQENRRLARLLFLSNLNRSKGIIDYLDALEILSQKMIPFVAKIAGNERDYNKNSILQLLRTRNLTDQVEYVGAVYGNEKDDLFIKSDIFVHPTLNEAWGLVILEAMQAGLPVVSTFEGSIPEIIDDGITGFLVSKNDTSALANKIEYLIKNKDESIAMGEAGKKKFYEKYTLEIFEKNILKVFDTILK